MNGELDLETYTLSIINLNTAFQKLEENENEAFHLFEKSAKNLENLYKDIVNDLNQDEVNFGEYYPFFENGKQIFPEYIDILGKVENEKFNDVITRLITIFNNLNKIADAFPSNKR